MAVLKPIKCYLYERFIQVVSNGKASSEREIFSGVPQGAKLSTLLWDFDISELPAQVGDSAVVGCYADDLWLGYEITDLSCHNIIDVVNQDLDSLLVWADGNRTTFEASKTYMMLVSNKQKPFDPSGIKMDGVDVKLKPKLKVTGFIFDNKINWGPYINMIACKARQRIGALRNLVQYMDSSNMKVMIVYHLHQVYIGVWQCAIRGC